jgi:hypothetical protein
MEGVKLVYLALAAILGAIVVALMGAFDALAKGEKWSWPKFGVSMFAGMLAGASYAGIGSKLPATTDLWLGILTAFGWGAGIDVTSNRIISLLLSKSLKLTSTKADTQAGKEAGGDSTKGPT